MHKIGPRPESGDRQEREREVGEHMLVFLDVVQSISSAYPFGLVGESVSL